MRLPHPAVLLITDRKVAKKPLDHVVRAALDGGCRWLSLREKDLAPDQRHQLLETLIVPTRAAGATFTVHEDLGAAAGVDGVHLPRRGDPEAARAQLGRRALIGCSAHDQAEALAAQAAGADYLTLSPVFPSLSKPGYDKALGLEGLSSVTSELTIPAIALGGITADTAAACRAAGAAGIAVCGVIMMAKDPAAAMAKVVNAFEG
ncbi:MAG: thiamine phosphate synthase [Pseudomonadota bacterium]